MVSYGERHESAGGTSSTNHCLGSAFFFWTQGPAAETLDLNSDSIVCKYISAAAGNSDTSGIRYRSTSIKKRLLEFFVNARSIII